MLRSVCNGRQRLAARERQQAVRQLGGIASPLQREFGRLAEDRKFFGDLALRLHMLEPALQRFQIADNDCQHVVEVVRDAAGQLADGFHLLRLDEGGLRLAPPPGLVLELGGAEIEFLHVTVAHLGEVQQQPDGAGERADHGADQHRAQSAGIADTFRQQVALDQIERRDLPPDGVHQRLARASLDEPDGFVAPPLSGECQHLPIDLGKLLPGG